MGGIRHQRDWAKDQKIKLSGVILGVNEIKPAGISITPCITCYSQHIMLQLI